MAKNTENTVETTKNFDLKAELEAIKTERTALKKNFEAAVQKLFDDKRAAVAALRERKAKAYEAYATAMKDKKAARVQAAAKLKAESDAKKKVGKGNAKAKGTMKIKTAMKTEKPEVEQPVETKAE